MKLAKLRKPVFVVVSAVLLWFVIFEWHFVLFPLNSNYGGPAICYSPNHDYYVKRYQTPVDALVFWLFPNFSSPPKGIAILYDKTGKKIYSGNSTVYASQEDGPYWIIDSVFFGEGWHVKLPSSPGALPTSPYGNTGCFDEKSDYVAPPPPSRPRRDFIVKGVEPLVKTKAPYQLQFLVEDQHGVPFTPHYYLIIREDGSRQRGTTDEHGRSFVVESTHDEVVKIYFSPLQKEDSFVMPEDIQGWCSESLDECIKIYTFTANTIKAKSD